MRIYLSVDMEGVVGVAAVGFSAGDGDEFFRRFVAIFRLAAAATV